jgi:hypothetical protein
LSTNTSNRLVSCLLSLSSRRHLLNPYSPGSLLHDDCHCVHSLPAPLSPAHTSFDSGLPQVMDTLYGLNGALAAVNASTIVLPVLVELGQGTLPSPRASKPSLTTALACHRNRPRLVPAPRTVRAGHPGVDGVDRDRVPGVEAGGESNARDRTSYC